jgi:hypothetical protein
MSETKKLKKITAVDEKDDSKKYYFKFKPLFNVQDDELVCETRCSYCDICDKIRDPRAIDDKDRCFEDFCGELGEVDDPENLNMIPVPGAIEEGFKDNIDIFQELIKTNPTICLSDMIEKVCSSGWCEDYNKEHTNCTAANKSCLMHDLFIKTAESE